MSEGLIIALLVAAVLVGVAAAAFLVMRSPSFWADAGKEIYKAAMPAIVRALTKRMPPEEEAAWRDCQKRGGKWNPVKRRCE